MLFHSLEVLFKWFAILFKIISTHCAFFSGDKINVDVVLKLAGGADNVADLTFKGEMTEAFADFMSQGSFAALNR